MILSFFDYKEFIDYEPWSDFLKLPHIILLLCAILFIIVSCICLRNISHKKIDIFLKVASIVVLVNESIKIIWETSYDLSIKGHFNWDGLLPLYTCSLFIFTLLIAAWCKGKARECALSFITTLSIFAGLTNFIYLNILATYPLFSYASMVSFFYHFFMVFTGIFLVSTKYYRPHLKDSIKAFIPVVLFSIIVIPLNFILINIRREDGSQRFWPNYMMYMDGQGLPLLETLETFFSSHHLTLIYSFIIMFSYYLIILLFIGIYNLIDYVKSKIKKDPSEN